MNFLFYIIIGFYCIILGFYMALKKKVSMTKYTIMKMTMSLTFTGLTIYGVLTNLINFQSILILITAISALFGDWFLRYLGIDAKKFNIGLVCFTITQLSLVLYFEYSIGLTLWLLLTLFISVLFTCIFWYMLKISNANLGENRLFVKSYMLTMSVLFGFALTYIITGNLASISAAFITIGAILFFISDIFLGIYAYLIKKRIFTMINSLLYFSGMLLIAVSFII